MKCFVFALKSRGAAPSGSDRGALITHLLFCLLVVVLSDGPSAEGRHKPHLRDAPDQDQAARHLLQRLPNPVQLRGTECMRSPFWSFQFLHLHSLYHAWYELNFFFSFFGILWMTTSHFLSFGHKGSCCWGLCSELRPLWNLAMSSKKPNRVSLQFACFFPSFCGIPLHLLSP